MVEGDVDMELAEPNSFVSVAHGAETLSVSLAPGSLRWPAAEMIGTHLLTLADETNRKYLALDFANIDFLAGTGLGQLVCLNTKVKTDGRQLVICNVNPQILEVLAVTGLTRVFDIDSVTD